MIGNPKLRFFKLHDAVDVPAFQTAGSACFDICAFFAPNAGIKIFTAENRLTEYYHSGAVFLNPLCRCLVPTGLVLDIPKGYSVRIHPRSGLAIKSGLSLANCEGIIDSDYTEQMFVPVVNLSNATISICHKERICQGELIKNLSFSVEEVENRPGRKTDRSGGFGSTGS